MRSLFRLSILALLSSVAFGCDDGVGENEENATEVLQEGSPAALSVLALVNDPATTAATLKDAKVTSTTAKAIFKHRDGADGVVRSGDEDLYDTVAELDAIKGVGPATLKNLKAQAEKLGYLEAQERKERHVIFSPQPADQSHNVEVARIIREAKTSIDIAMYSYSDAGIQAALADAVKRGVKVRMVFETASQDRKLTGSALTASKSGKLEAIGVDVRWVNKIMHHKFMIVDGPRDDVKAAETATVVSGSGNWSSGAATKYDENTLFLTAYPELALRTQREFNLMWDDAKDLVAVASVTSEPSSLEITDDLIVEDPGIHAFYTSNNFSVNGTTFTISGSNTIADELVRAIEAAEERIHIASGHLRSRPVSEALMAKRASDPEIDIVLYLDGQEYVSDSTNDLQKSDKAACVAAATTENQKQKCLDKDYLYGRDVELAGIDVRYKYYAYRWDTSYAAQMHNKFLIVDDALYTGSYNLSDNAEHNTFENMLRFSGPEFADLVEDYETRFQELRAQGEGLLPGLTSKIDTDATIPIVFPAMSLSWTEIRDLKSLIAAECPKVNSLDFRQNAAAHQTCTK
jgi:phosphatidylserine/phosphatidylglycerophosphate/cardiolipin synthase-like enzyme